MHSVMDTFFSYGLPKHQLILNKRKAICRTIFKSKLTHHQIKIGVTHLINPHTRSKNLFQFDRPTNVPPLFICCVTLVHWLVEIHDFDLKFVQQMALVVFSISLISVTRYETDESITQWLVCVNVQDMVEFQRTLTLKSNKRSSAVHSFNRFSHTFVSPSPNTYYTKITNQFYLVQLQT